MTRRVVYDVAISIDRFIDAGEDDVSAFAMQGDHVDAYQQRLAGYGAVVMGRRTYEAGYAFGMKPGDKPYPHMQHHVISRTLTLPPNSEVEIVRDDPITFVRTLRTSGDRDIYLCGGGMLAGALLRANLIDCLILKVNPFVLGAGTSLFGEQGRKLDIARRFHPSEVRHHRSGVALLVYNRVL
jgi:dihydrofolate reductase